MINADIDILTTPVYYIGFNKKEELEKSFNKRGFKNINHFKAIDGRKINLLKARQNGIIGDRVFHDLKYGRSDGAGIPSKGAIGCYLSHISVMRIMIERNLPYIIIAEDDLIINKFNPKKVNKILKEIYSKDDNSLVLLGWEKGCIGAGQICKVKGLFWGCYFMFLSKTVCENIVKQAFPINIQLDGYFSIINDIKIINVYGLNKKIGVHDHLIHTSSIQENFLNICYKCLLPNNPWFYNIIILVFVGIIIAIIILIIKNKECSKKCK